ncbi:flavin prenyltransferase UbiX [Candidatus Deferrimicrobium sp.]|uniref:UbiX family flavin prenyltransferase n=1 Tax=Candidatus Deferrimicrobium sp. TaxID=3060586 RepID=UPI002ED22196
MKVLLGISGASGAAYGIRTLSLLLAGGADLHVLVTNTAWGILAAEIGDGKFPGGAGARRKWLARFSSSARPFRLYAEDDFAIPFASGSNVPDAMIVSPCSMGTLGRIAHGVSSSVLTRCADVVIKERKPLVLVTRETPLSVIHLENMLTLARAGAHVLPACPGFYHRPETVAGLVDFVGSRALSCIGIDAGVLPRWGEEKEE